MNSRLLASSLLERSRLVVAAALLVVVISSAGYILAGAGTDMSTLGMVSQTGPAGALLSHAPDVLVPAVWSPGYAVVIFFMWWLMMIAMMVPSAAPAILLFEALNRNQPLRATFEFVSGYLIVWGLFSLAATAIQFLLVAAGLASSMYMTLGSPYLASAVLVLAGAYQFTPVKAACLTYCRGPADGLSRHRYQGRTAAFRKGLSLGAYCLGCCWALMLLLFVGGVMNLWWIAGLALYVAVEKLTPFAKPLSLAFGGALIAAGLVLLVGSIHS